MTITTDCFRMLVSIFSEIYELLTELLCILLGKKEGGKNSNLNASTYYYDLLVIKTSRRIKNLALLTSIGLSLMESLYHIINALLLLISSCKSLLEYVNRRALNYVKNLFSNQNLLFCLAYIWPVYALNCRNRWTNPKHKSNCAPISKAHPLTSYKPSRC